MKWTRTSIAALGVTALLSGGCSEDPLGEGTGQATAIQASRSEANLTVSRTFTVTARVLDAQFTPLPIALSATAGSNLRVDSVVFVREMRETRVFVTPTALLTEAPSTLTLSAAGLTETVEIFAFPRTIQADVPLEVQSGQSIVPTVQAFDEMAVSLGTVEFTVTSDDESIIEIGPDGELIAKGVGQAALTFSGPGGGITQEVFVNVVPGIFAGSAAVSNPDGMQGITFTPPGGMAFDEDTEVTFEGVPGGWAGSISPTELFAVLPVGLPAGPVNFVLGNVGESQLALAGTVTLPGPVPAGNAFEPGNDAPGAGPTVTDGSLVGYGFISGSDVDDFFLLVIEEGDVFDVILNWDTGADLDLYVADITFTNELLGFGGATSNNPEQAEVTLDPGTYLIWVNYWSGPASTYRVRLERH